MGARSLLLARYVLSVRFIWFGWDVAASESHHSESIVSALREWNYDSCEWGCVWEGEGVGERGSVWCMHNAHCTWPNIRVKSTERTLVIRWLANNGLRRNANAKAQRVGFKWITACGVRVCQMNTTSIMCNTRNDFIQYLNTNLYVAVSPEHTRTHWRSTRRALHVHWYWAKWNPATIESVRRNAFTAGTFIDLKHGRKSFLALVWHEAAVVYASLTATCR